MARLNVFEYQKHNLDAMAKESKVTAQDRLIVGQRVKILMQRSIFRKHQPLKKSLWSENIFYVTRIDKSSYPPVYFISDHTKKFYAFELQALPEPYPLNDNNQNKKTIFVDSFHLPEKPYLRSGRSKVDKDEAIYTIMREGKIYSVNKNDLINFKKVLGDGSLVYSSFFSDPQKSKYLI